MLTKQQVEMLEALPGWRGFFAEGIDELVNWLIMRVRESWQKGKGMGDQITCGDYLGAEQDQHRDHIHSLMYQIQEDVKVFANNAHRVDDATGPSPEWFDLERQIMERIQSATLVEKGL